MPSPIAHSVSGYVLAKILHRKFPLSTNRNWWYWFSFYGVFIAIVADFDFIPQIITGQQFHRGITHTLIFAIGFSLLMAWLINSWQKSSFRRAFVITVIIYLSHLFLDWLTAGGNGVQLLAPFSETYFKSAIPLFPAVRHSHGLLDPIHLRFLIWESSYCVLLFISLNVWEKLYQKMYKKDRC